MVLHKTIPTTECTDSDEGLAIKFIVPADIHTTPLTAHLIYESMVGFNTSSSLGTLVVTKEAPNDGSRSDMDNLLNDYLEDLMSTPEFSLDTGKSAHCTTSLLIPLPV